MEPFRILEWGATFVESVVILSTIAAASQKRQQDLRHYCLLVLSAVSLTVLTGFMNSISAFSFLTPLVAMCFIVLVLSYILRGAVDSCQLEAGWLLSATYGSAFPAQNVRSE